MERMLEAEGSERTVKCGFLGIIYICTHEFIAILVSCMRPRQDKASQYSGTDVSQPFTKELLVFLFVCFLFLSLLLFRVWPPVGGKLSREDPHIHLHMGSINWTQ